MCGKMISFLMFSVLYFKLNFILNNKLKIKHARFSNNYAEILGPSNRREARGETARSAKPTSGQAANPACTGQVSFPGGGRRHSHSPKETAWC